MSEAVGRTHSPRPSDPLQAGQQELQHQYDGGTFQNIGSVDARTEKAAKLLAAILVFYSNTMLNPIPLSHLPPLLKDLDAFVQTAPSPTTQFLAKGATPLEQQSSSIALSPVGANTTLLADHLFYTITNLRRPLHSFQTSIEVRFLLSLRRMVDMSNYYQLFLTMISFDDPVLIVQCESHIQHRCCVRCRGITYSRLRTVIVSLFTPQGQ
jgi:hypothetical protein